MKHSELELSDPTEPIGFKTSLLIIISVIMIIFSGYALLGLDLRLSMVLAIIFTMCASALGGGRFSDIERHICHSIGAIIPLILILLSVGCLIGTWIASGTVPTLIYAGLSLLSTKYFLVSVVLLCMITSLATGTSWGTIATTGLAMMGVGSVFGIAPAITAGAIISGAYFGDKLSPLSDSTNLAPALAGTGLFPHIQRTLWTTLPAIAMTLIIFAIIGLSDAPHHVASLDSVREIMEGLEHHFTIGWLSMLPLALVIPVLIAGLPAYIAIMAGAIAGSVVAIVWQGASLADMTNTLYNGYHLESGLAALDQLLNRGGMSTMYPLAMLFFVAGGLGGALSGSGAIDRILATLIRYLDSRRKIMLSAIPMVFVSLMVGASFSFAALMSATLMKPLFDKFAIDRENLSRIIEDIGTVNDPTLPWSSGGIYVSGILGVATLDYIPFMYFSFFSALFSILYAVTGFSVTTSNRKRIRETLNFRNYNVSLN